MRVVRNHPRLTVIALLLFAIVLFVGGYGVWLAGEAGELPWQVDPTRIAIEPFSGIPGFNVGTPVPSGTPVP